MKTPCNCTCKKDNVEDTCCKQAAESRLEEMLQKTKKNPDGLFLQRIQQIVLSENGKNLHKKQEEAFSFSEAIDKFVIIALKQKYLSGEKLVHNKKDYDAMEAIMEHEFQRHKIEDVTKLFDLLPALWEVNAEIFCINDICGEEEDDRIVAASARRMIVMIKERNRIKHEIAELLHETMHETKQFKQHMS